VQFFQELVRLWQYVQSQRLNINMQVVAVSDIVTSLLQDGSTNLLDGTPLDLGASSNTSSDCAQFSGTLNPCECGTPKGTSSTSLFSGRQEIVKRLLTLCSDIGEEILWLSCIVRGMLMTM
jgi:hypothetical protein